MLLLHSSTLAACKFHAFPHKFIVPKVKDSRTWKTFLEDSASLEKR
jgi:hypothetical protein